jgi:hypothetical protein
LWRPIDGQTYRRAHPAKPRKLQGLARFARRLGAMVHPKRRLLTKAVVIGWRGFFWTPYNQSISQPHLVSASSLVCLEEAGGIRGIEFEQNLVWSPPVGPGGRQNLLVPHKALGPPCSNRRPCRGAAAGSLDGSRLQELPQGCLLRVYQELDVVNRNTLCERRGRGDG